MEKRGTVYINQDYYRAGEEKWRKILLELVESAHFNDRVKEDLLAGKSGPIGDIKYTLDKFPNHPEALPLIGFIAKRYWKSPSKAIVYYENAVNRYPEYAITQAQYGIFLVEIGMNEDGIYRLKKAVELDPKLAMAHAWLATAYKRTGNPRLAEVEANNARALGFERDIPDPPVWKP